MKEKIHSTKAPEAIGSYSQAIRVGDMLYLSGQIPLSPVSKQIISSDVKQQVIQVFENIRAVLEAAGVDFDQIVKLTVYLTDLNHFAILNEVMSLYFKEPYPARTTLQVTALPKAAQVEVDVIACVYQSQPCHD